MDQSEIDVPPRTIGELRRRLEAMGNPWTVSPRFADDDLLPQPPRGGQTVPQGHVPGLKSIDTLEDFRAHVHAATPVNAFLAQRWDELGLLTTSGTAESVEPPWGVA